MQKVCRTLDQGSRLSATRLGRYHEIGFLNLGPFDGDTLYANHDWIAENQARMENALYTKRHGDAPCMWDKEAIHAKYKDLAMVENAFGTCETGPLELRPIDVRKAGRTRSHVFVVMLSYLLTHELRESWGQLDVTVEEGLELLSTLCTARIKLPGGVELHQIPSMRQDLAELYRLRHFVKM